MKKIMLNCWVRGLDTARILEVKISKVKTIASLKEAIWNKKPATFRDMDADALDLYKPMHPVGEPYEDNLRKITLLEDGVPLRIVTYELSTVFLGTLCVHDIHIIVGM